MAEPSYHDGLLVPQSPGDVLDRLTILELKLQRIRDPEKLALARHEHEVLSYYWNQSPFAKMEVTEQELGELASVNAQLWDIDERLRELEKNETFGQPFIELARQVYIINDRRAAIRRRINGKLGSQLVEVKSHS